MRSREEDDEAERARLDRELRLEAARLLEIEGRLQRARIECVESRIRFGDLLEQRLAITPRGQKGDYVARMAEEWGFGERKANDNRVYARLHHLDPETSFNFASLANLSVEQVRDLYRENFLGDERSARIADERIVQAVENAVDAAVLTKDRLKQADLRQLLQYHQQGWNRKARETHERWIAASIFRRGTPLSPEEQGRGLSNLMMDSGAYTASTQGTEIDLDDYCTFLLEHSWITTYINLDKIDPHLPGTGESGLISYNNFRHMRERGLHPIPVFHAGEELSWLEKYIHEEDCSYIGLGGVADNRNINKTMAVFDQCFEIIERSGQPIKTHAFGVAVPEILLKYPFDSADSTAWIYKAQKFRSTDISRLGGPSWRASLTPSETYAARTYLEALDAHRLERQVRETRDFTYHLVLRQENPWWLPALWTVGHRNALMSFYERLDPAVIRQFIDDPLSILNRRRYAEKLELLEEMKARCSEYMAARSRGEHRERDGAEGGFDDPENDQP